MDASRTVEDGCSRRWCASTSPRASRSPRRCWSTAAGLGVSSATVRNILARLEEEGFVQQPHTSAGRIPTDRGYRFYVDLLLESKRPSRTASAVEARLRRDSPDRLLDSLLPQVSHMRLAGVAQRRLRAAAGARGRGVRPRRVRAAQRGARARRDRRRGGHVIQKVIELGEPLDADELRQAANYLNAEFSGLPLHRAREAVLERINEERLALRRAAGARDAAGHVDVLRSARRSADVRRRRLVAARRRRTG